MIKSQLPYWNIQNKRVLLRADLNIPLQETKILNDFKLQSIVATIDYLLKQNVMVILATHIGQPKNYSPNLSTKILIEWFKKHNYSIIHIANPLAAQHLPFMPHYIVLLENLRFFPEEKNCDPFFARQLAQTADYYVNDAFGSLHRNDCSISLVPFEFTENKRTIGFLIEKELLTLNKIKNDPQQPFIAILGGKKIKDKIPLIEGLLSTANSILICPALSFSFLAATGQDIGKSLIDTSVFEKCKKIVLTAQEKSRDLIFPIDYQIASTTVDGLLSYCDAINIPSNAIGVSIGPKTVNFFKQKINSAHTIFFNCAMGFVNNPKTQQSTNSLLRLIASSNAMTIVAGGDTVEMVFALNIQASINHLSTGGGATLAYLSGNLLPGLVPFEEL